jgi:hypothetical protein
MANKVHSLLLCVPSFGLFIYFINALPSYFPSLLFQTRYWANCFAKQPKEDRAENVFIAARNPPRAAKFRHLILHSNWTI